LDDKGSDGNADEDGGPNGVRGWRSNGSKDGGLNGVRRRGLGLVDTRITWMRTEVVTNYSSRFGRTH
jgi:hypothetical protein